VFDPFFIIHALRLTLAISVAFGYINGGKSDGSI